MPILYNHDGCKAELCGRHARLVPTCVVQIVLNTQTPPPPPHPPTPPLPPLQKKKTTLQGTKTILGKFS